jgi:CHAD domain-containing protein
MEYLLPAGVDARDVLGSRADVRADRARTSRAVFYDTFDGRLYAEGVTLRHLDGRLALLEKATGDELAGDAATAARRLFAEDLPEPLRERLADVIEMRALVPVARLRLRRQTLAVLNEDAKTVVRLAVETPDGFPSRVSAVAVRGYDGELTQVSELSELTEATVPLVDEAVAANGGRPEGTSSKLDLTLEPGQPANEAAAVVFDRLLEVIGDNLPGTLEDVDSEFLHDLRVAVRRSRSLQRQFKSIYPDRLQHFRDEFKRLQQVTGDLRDLDVYMLDFDALKRSLPPPMREDLEPLRAILSHHRARALNTTRRALRARRTEDALSEWRSFVHDAPTADRSVADLASRRIRRVYRKMVKMGSAIDDDSPAADLHELRKVGKELRYLLEFFQSLYPPDVVKPLIKTLKGLQEMLGRFQDREVQAQYLRAIAPEVSDQATVMAMGALVARFMEEEAAARSEFAERFDAFAGRPQRRLVKDHFA